MRNTARSALKAVMEENGLDWLPKSGSQIRPIPVYEGNNINLERYVSRKTLSTSIVWPETQSDTYLPGYYKQIRTKSGENRNEVVVIAENYCYARWIAAKELMHGLIEDDNYPATNSIDLVNQLIDELAAGPHRASCAPQTAVDEAAWLGAAYYLIPSTWIPLLKQMISDIEQQAPDSARDAYLHVAREIRVPEIILRSVLNNPYYIDY